MKNKRHIKSFDEATENLNISDVSDSIKINEGDEFGVVNIQIDGSGFIKQSVTEDIRRILSKYQGERHLYVDGKEINPYQAENEKPFYMTSRSGNKVDYNPFGNNEYKQYDIS